MKANKKDLIATWSAVGIMDNIKVTINKDFKFKTLTVDDGYIITNNANGFEFQTCLSLENVTCVEELPKCSISFNTSDKLTLDSVTNIITHLPDLSGEDRKTLTLHATTKALLTEALIAEATSKNWIIA